jgi:hypothetical protein
MARKRLPTAVIAAIFATIVAAIPLALGLDERERGECYGGLCGLIDLYFVAIPIVWLASWPIFCLIIWGIRKADAAAAERGPTSGDGTA